MSLVGRKFRIKLSPHHYGSEHHVPLLATHEGRLCRLVEHWKGDMYVTDITLPEGTPDSDYARGGRLIVMADKDGRVQGRPPRT